MGYLPLLLPAVAQLRELGVLLVALTSIFSIFTARAFLGNGPGWCPGLTACCGR